MSGRSRCCYLSHKCSGVVFYNHFEVCHVGGVSILVLLGTWQIVIQYSMEINIIIDE